MTLESLFDSLHRAGHLPSATVPAIDLERNHSPWYTRVLLGGMGWLGGMLVLGFLGALIYGQFMVTVDMKTGAPMGGTPEAAQMMYLMGALARKYKLPRLNCIANPSWCKLKRVTSQYSAPNSL